MSLLKLLKVKEQLNIEHDLEDPRIQRCIDLGEAIVFDYLKTDVSTFMVGSPAVLSLPLHVEAGMVLCIEALYDGTEDPLTPAVVSILARSRDPAFA